MKLLAPLSALALLALAGCATNTTPMFCPQTAVLQQAQRLDLFLPGRSDVAAQVTEAQVTGVAGACVLRPKKHALAITLQAGFSATNGPANHSATLNLPYFVVISEGDTILHKYEETIALSFDDGAAAATASSKKLTIELPNDHDSAKVEVLVGFELTQDQLNYAETHPASP